METIFNAVTIGFMAGFVFGMIIKGRIDRKFERAVQKTLIEVGQMADNEIEEKDKEIERLKNVVHNLQIERAIIKLKELEELNI